MKVSREQAVANRERIVKVAAKRFREDGFDGVGVADLMQDAGLTHGGFYGHFESKESLIAEAVSLTLANSAETWSRVIGSAPENPLRALVEFYLSAKHRDGPGEGCLIAAVGAEAGRHGQPLKEKIASGLEPLLGLLAGIVPGDSESERREAAIAVYAGLIGGMVLARAVGDAGLSAEILRAVSDSLPKAAPIV